MKGKKMRRFGQIFLAAFTAVSLCGVPIASASPSVSGNAHQTVVKNGEQASFYGSEKIFTGRVRIDKMFDQIDDRQIAGAYVTFEPCARSSWHTHPKGQVLVVTSGSGLTQEWGKAIQTLQPGDVVWCPPGVKHWHGGGYKTAMTHISLCESVEGENVHWLEKVSDQQYFGK